MKWLYVGVMLTWIVLSYALIQHWPEARVFIPFSAVALTLPLVWVKTVDGQLLALAIVSIVVTALSGFGQLAVVYFLFAIALAWLLRSLPVPASVRILIAVMSISLFETILGSYRAGYDTFLLAAFVLQTFAGFLVAYTLVNTKAMDYET